MGRDRQSPGGMSRRVMYVLCTLCFCYTLVTLGAWMFVTSSGSGTTTDTMTSYRTLDRTRRDNDDSGTMVPVLRVPHAAVEHSTKPASRAVNMMAEEMYDESENISANKNRWVFNHHKQSGVARDPSSAVDSESRMEELRMLEEDVRRRHRSDENRVIENAISIHLVGGVGNIMFQYAALLGTAKSLGKSPYLEYSARSAYLLNFFNMSSANVLTKSQHQDFVSRAHRYHERSWGRYEPSIRKIDADDTYLAGFFQSWKYFDQPDLSGIKEQVRREFELNEENMFKARRIVKEIRREARDSGATGGNVTLIGVHVRRGDYLARPGWRVPSAEYFIHAMSKMEDEFEGNVVFVIVSDDISWCKEHLIPRTHVNLFISEQSSHMVDFGVLTLCDHHILSVGSFGWWSAWLAGGQVIYYRDWVSTELQFYYSERDYFPPLWRGIGDKDLLAALSAGN